MLFASLVYLIIAIAYPIVYNMIFENNPEYRDETVFIGIPVLSWMCFAYMLLLAIVNLSLEITVSTQSLSVFTLGRKKVVNFADMDRCIYKIKKQNNRNIVTIYYKSNKKMVVVIEHIDELLELFKENGVPCSSK